MLITAIVDMCVKITHYTTISIEFSAFNFSSLVNIKTMTAIDHLIHMPIDQHIHTHTHEIYQKICRFCFYEFKLIRNYFAFI